MPFTIPEHKTHDAPSITRDAAWALLEAARAAARDIGIDVAIAVTDAAGHFKAFERSDHAPFLTAEVAIDKAWTAASAEAGVMPGSSMCQADASIRSARLPPPLSGDWTASITSRPGDSAASRAARRSSGSTTARRPISRYSASLATPVGAAEA